jgi:hypothetical protein
MRLQQLDKIYVDVITLRNATTQRAHTFKIHLPPIAPQNIIDGERVLLATALQVRIVVMLCKTGKTAQSIAMSQSAIWRRFASSRSCRRRSTLTNLAVQN